MPITLPKMPGWDPHVAGVTSESLEKEAAAAIPTGQKIDTGNNKIVGTDGNNNINGLAGNDTIFGNKGNDTIIGSDGIDFLYGGEGKDWLNAGWESGGLYGGEGDDNLDGFSGEVMYYGGNGGDYMIAGNASNAPEYNFSPKDTMYGGNGDDYLIAQSKDDLLYGDDGHDRMLGGTNNDTLFGGEGNDWLDGEATIHVLTYIKGETHKDYLEGGNGVDTIFGGEGVDTLDGGAGNDILIGGAHGDEITGAAGSDTVYAFATHGGAYQMTKAQAQVAAAEWLNGDVLVDFEAGADKIDLSFAMAGGKFIGAGAFSKAANQVRYDKATGLLSGDTNGDGKADWTMTLKNKAALTASDFNFDATRAPYLVEVDDAMYKGRQFWDSEGYGPDPKKPTDTVTPKPDVEKPVVADKGLTLTGKKGNDKLSGQDGADVINGGKGNDKLSGGAGDDKLFGGAGRDVMDGGAGNDILSGGATNDKMTGGAGADVFLFNSTVGVAQMSAKAMRAEITGMQGDVITDFETGVDKIDLSFIMEGGAFIGSAAFAGTKKALVADQVRYDQTKGKLSGDVDGDGKADWTITISNKAALTASDFDFIA